MDFADTFSHPYGRGPSNPCEANGLDTRDPGNVTSIYSNNLPWTPPNDFASINYTDLSYTGTSLSGPQSRSVSMDDTTSQLNSVDARKYGLKLFPKPLLNTTERTKRSKKVCLQSLQDMHSASSPDPPPFDVVLSLNRKAVESCAALLACAPCLSRSGTHTTAMLLATIIGKITSFYQKATHSYFDGGIEDGIAGQGSMHGLSGTGASLGISLGAYTLGGEDGRWLELEILARELQKLEEVYAQFRDVCGELTEDPEVSRAMIGYLGHNLGTTLKVVSHRKGGMKRA
ncbi:hypothetical protein BN1723_014664 [Verticillium longisporum]|uniref:Aflatoxin regulatory protein domain-containing protein n=1 Tax=Verticillium longisporum TaxID=100787 RepID=A0A0G4MF33_VERLO|nr:hypothetical protein BN1723_014664 [Verticillium longisporum]